MNREETAYHEAGHAVICILEGGAVKSASIVEDDDSWGRINKNKPGKWFHPDVEWDGRTRKRTELEIMTLLAGPLAQERFSGEWDAVGASGDLDAVGGLAMRATGGTEEADAYLEWLRLRTLGKLRNPLVWERVETVATALLEQGTLSAKTIRDIALPSLPA